MSSENTHMHLLRSHKAMSFEANRTLRGIISPFDLMLGYRNAFAVDKHTSSRLNCRRSIYKLLEVTLINPGELILTNSYISVLLASALLC